MGILASGAEPTLKRDDISGPADVALSMVVGSWPSARCISRTEGKMKMRKTRDRGTGHIWVFQKVCGKDRNVASF